MRGCENSHRRSGVARAVLIGIALLCSASLLAGCADFQKKPPQKKLPSRTQKVQPKSPSGRVPGEVTPERELPKDTMRPAATAPAATPAKAASDRLIDKGKGLLDAKDYERAASAFREAVGVDAQNGPAYYYLALAQVRLGQTSSAAGLLDKADTLVGNDPEWTQRIDALRAELGVTSQRPVVPSPIDKAF
jgi:tetratricopeptide (TPR) repeat protein